MASEIKLPVLGENLGEGEILEVTIAPGDTVTEGQMLLEIEADKSTVGVPSPAAGKVAKVLVKKGDVVKTGQTFCLIETTANGTATAEPKEKTASAEPKNSPSVPKDKPATPARDKEKSAPPTTKVAPSKQDQPAASSQARDGSAPLVPAGPATRQLARKLGVDLAQVSGTAAGGRVTREDVEAFVRNLASRPGGTTRGHASAPPLPDFSQWGPVETRPMDAVRRKTAEHMSLSWSQVPQVTQFDQADITDFEAFRKKQSADGPKLTVTPFVLKAIALALKDYPQFNASIDVGSQKIVMKGYFHVGVAVDTDRGLLVPVVRDVDQKSIEQLAREVGELAEKARNKKLTLEEMRGGTFTLTNLGGLGGTGFSPIVNYPEVAILGLARARMQPVYQDGQFVPRLLLPLSLSYDHRLIDGAAAARFTRHIAELLANPYAMLMKA